MKKIIAEGRKECNMEERRKKKVKEKVERKKREKELQEVQKEHKRQIDPALSSFRNFDESHD